MSGFTEYFLNSGANVVQLELLEISHPNFSKVYRIVRNAINGVTVTHEDASVHTYDYYPLQVTPVGNSQDLDQKLQVILGDLGDVIPKEIDAVRAAGALGTKPTIKYRTYRSDDLTTPLTGPFTFVMDNLPRNWQGANFEARAPRLNVTSTGERYTFDRFPPLKGFL